MTNSKKVLKTDEKEDYKDKNLFKRFRINSKTFKIEKSDFDQKLSVNKHNKEHIHDPNMDKKNPNQEEEDINEFNNENNFIFKDDDTEKNNNHHDEYANQESLIFEENEPIFEENEIVDEKLLLSSKIKEIIFNDPEKKIPILPILGLVIGIFLIITSVMILLGNSDRVVDSVSSGETSASSVLICFIGIIFLALSLLKIFPQEKAFGNIFHIIKDFESETNKSNSDNKNDEINTEFQDEEG